MFPVLFLNNSENSTDLDNFWCVKIEKIFTESLEIKRDVFETHCSTTTSRPSRVIKALPEHQSTLVQLTGTRIDTIILMIIDICSSCMYIITMSFLQLIHTLSF